MQKKITMAALMLTMEQAKEVMGKHNDFRPPQGTAPWHEERREWRWHKPDYAMNYKVPNFGLDHDIETSQTNLADSERLLQHKWNPKKNEKGAYVLPNSANAHSTSTYKPRSSAQVSGQEEYVQTGTESDPVCHSGGCTQYLHPKPDKSNLYPMNYYVPNFGRDEDVTNTWTSLGAAEGIRNHRWRYNPDDKKKPEDPIQYDFQPDLDDDIVDTQSNMGAAEKKLGKWTFKPADPRQGLSQIDALGSNESFDKNQLAELQRQHAESLIQQKSESGSDPACHSAGCT